MGDDLMRFGAPTALSRRNLFEIAGLGLWAAAAPSGKLLAATHGAAVAAGSTPGSVMEKLSAYMSEAATRALPDEVAETTKQHVLDALAAMISGSELPPGRAALQFSREYGGKEVATVVAANFLCGPIEAALTNGMLAHADETDDSHSPSQSHPGCAVVPAALAAGESCAAGCNAQQMRWMLGYAAHQSSGLGAWNRDIEHVQKAFHFGGMTARSGVTAALLVQAGWTGVDDILAGKDNFFSAYNSHAEPAGLIDKLGERYEVTRTNIKKWPVGSPIQAALDALENLRAQRRPFAAAQVKEVTVRLATNEAAIVNNREIPDICLQHVMAVALLDKTVTFASVHDNARLTDPGTLRARAKIRLVPDEELQSLMPLRAAIVDVTLVDGTHLSRRIDDVRGTPNNPMTRTEIVAKASDLIAPILGPVKCASLIERIFQLDSVRSIRDLRPLLQRG